MKNHCQRSCNRELCLNLFRLIPSPNPVFHSRFEKIGISALIIHIPVLAGITSNMVMRIEDFPSTISTPLILQVKVCICGCIDFFLSRSFADTTLMRLLLLLRLLVLLVLLLWSTLFNVGEIELHVLKCIYAHVNNILRRLRNLGFNSQGKKKEEQQCKPLEITLLFHNV